MTANLRQLTDSLVSNFVGYRGGSLLVLADEPSLEIGHSIVDSGKAIESDGECNIELIDIDIYRRGKPLTEIPDALRDELRDKLRGTDQDHNTVLYVMRCLEGETPLRVGIVKLAASKGKIGGLPECTTDVLQAAFHPDNKPGFSAELFDFLSGVTEVQLTCDRGSDVTVVLDNQRYDLVNSNGVLIPSKYTNPIPAEVYAHPASVDGTLVISGSYSPLMGFKPFVGNYQALMRALNQDPITWTIKDSKITDVDCDNEELRKFVRTEVFEKDTEHGMKIGEFGLPANLYVLAREITGNLMIDEKGRVHLANGHGYQPRTRCEYDSAVHGDGLIVCASLRAVNLNREFMRDNKYSPEVFKTLKR